MTDVPVSMERLAQFFSTLLIFYDYNQTSNVDSLQSKEINLVSSSQV
jgi:hypothetical protein